MDERIRLIIEAQNRAAPAFQSVARGMTTIGANAKAAGEAVGRAAVHIRDTLVTVGHACQRAGAAFVRMGQTAKTGLDMIGGPLKTITTGLAGLGVAGGAAATAFGVLGVKSNQFKENTLAALTGMTKSKAVAEDLYKFLTKFADTTPFDDEEIVSAGKALMTFGFDAKRVLTLVGDTAFTMKVPLEQVVNTLAKLKAGTFDTAEMGPVGISREGLEGMGQTFSAGGEPENRAALLGQGMALLQAKFGGAMASGASGFDAAASTMESNFRRLAAMATSGLFESLKKGFDSVSGALTRFMETGKGVGGLKVVFDGLGKAFELVAKAGMGFVEWLDAVISRDSVAFVLASILGTLQTIGEYTLKLFGVDLKAAMDPKNVHSFFQALAVGADAGISIFFGLGRVANEVVRAMFSGFQDLGERIGDTVQDISRGITLLFLSMQQSMAETTMMMMDSMSKILFALSEVSVFGQRPFKQLETAAAGMWVSARMMENPAVGAIPKLQEAQAGIRNDMQLDQIGRNARWMKRKEEDPYRDQNIFRRINDAWKGRPGEMGAEGEFRSLLQQNIVNIGRSLFGGAAAAAPSGNVAPMLYGGGGRGGSSISYPRSMTPAIPSMPGYLDPGLGGVGTGDWTADYIRRRDSGMGNGGQVTNVFSPVGMLTREQFHQWVDEWFDQTTRQAISGPAGF